MGQDITNAMGLSGCVRRMRWASMKMMMIGSMCLDTSCSREAAGPRNIRAHTVSRGGVAHAEPAAKVERYCALCHGMGLKGGTGLEPSCFTCHGKTWGDQAFEPPSAPADHSVMNQNFHHLPGLKTPDVGCTACHGGAALAGDITSGLTVPGCDLCHGRLWD